MVMHVGAVGKAYYDCQDQQTLSIESAERQMPWVGSWANRVRPTQALLVTQPSGERLVQPLATFQVSIRMTQESQAFCFRLDR